MQLPLRDMLWMKPFSASVLMQVSCWYCQPMSECKIGLAPSGDVRLSDHHSHFRIHQRIACPRRYCFPLTWTVTLYFERAGSHSIPAGIFHHRGSYGWGRHWGALVGAYWGRFDAHIGYLLSTLVLNPSYAKALKTKGKPRNFNEVPGLHVEMGGIEPPSNSRPRGLLRAQSASYFSAPGIMQTCYQIGSVD